MSTTAGGTPTEEKEEPMIAKLPEELAEDYVPKNIMVTGGAGTLSQQAEAHKK